MTAIVLTGASRGIGAAIAERLRAEPDVRLLALASADGDLANPETPGRLWARAEAELGRVDVLINNAGVFEDAPLELDADAWLAVWERTLRINLLAAAALSRAAVQHFRARGGGRLVNIASRAAYRGDSPAHWHYAASKAGMVAMTKSIARGFAGEGVLAYSVCPGFVMTGMAEEYLAGRGGAKILGEIPLGRVATPDEVAEVTAFCALRAPPSMTGAAIDVNGASFVR